MYSQQEGEEVTADAVAVLGEAVQNLVAARLGRALLPLGILFAWGTIAVVGQAHGRVAVGAVVAAAAMLAYGMRIVQETLGRTHRSWMTLAMASSVVPPVYALFILGWQGFRMLATASTSTTVVSAILYIVLGVWVLRSWMRVVEVERLARSVVANLESPGGGT